MRSFTRLVILGWGVPGVGGVVGAGGLVCLFWIACSVMNVEVLGGCIETIGRDRGASLLVLLVLHNF